MDKTTVIMVLVEWDQEDPSRVHGAGGEMGHTGEDYAMPVGKPLTMIAKGTVVDVGMGEMEDTETLSPFS